MPSFGRFMSTLFALLLISVGIAMLLDNLSIIYIDIPYLLSTFWPIILIFIGFYLILMRSRIFRHSKNVILSEKLDGVSKAVIRIDFGVGELAINPLSKEDMLFEGSFVMKPGVSVTKTDDTANILLKQVEWPWFEPIASGMADRWSLGLTTQARLTLTINTGASRLFMDLKENIVDSVTLSAGASDVSICFPKASGVTNAVIKGGATNIRLEIPQGVGGRIVSTGALGSFYVDQNRFPKRDSQYVSPDYDVAANKINIEVSAGVSSVSIV